MEILDQLFVSLSLHCRDLIWSPAHPSTLTLFIDGKEKIGLDDTSAATSIVLDNTDLLDKYLPHSDYQLEVSSPGYEKPLRTPQHFSEVQGESIFVKVSQKVDGKVVFKGKLLQCDVETIDVEVRDKKYSIPIVNILQANLIDKKFGHKEDMSHGS